MQTCPNINTYLFTTIQEVLKPLKVATEALSTDKYPTASAVLPSKHVLLSQLSKQTPDAPEPPALTEMKTKIITDLEKRYKASYLDPCFHCLVHLKEEQKRDVQVTILEEMKQVNVEEGTGSETKPGAGQPRDQQTAGKTALTAMGDLFRDTYCTDRPDQDNTRQFQKEMSMYEQESPIPAQQILSCGGKPRAPGDTLTSPKWQRNIFPSLDPQCILNTSFPLLGI